MTSTKAVKRVSKDSELLTIERCKQIKESFEHSWFIDNVLPKESIGVLYGESGSGKTTYALYLCEQILKNNNSVSVFYLDADMGEYQLTRYGIDSLMQSYPDNFQVYVLKPDYETSYKKKLKGIMAAQRKKKDSNFVVLVDCLGRVATKTRQGFIDTKQLYAIESTIRANGGAILLLHHTNKKGVLNDTQQIVNSADYVMKCENNKKRKTITINPTKSRYFDGLQIKCYKYKDSKIIKEIPFYMAIFNESEKAFVESVLEQLESGKTKQSDLIAVLKKDKRVKLGENKMRELLKKFADEHHLWHYEQTPQENNAIYYFLKDER